MKDHSRGYTPTPLSGTIRRTTRAIYCKQRINQSITFSSSLLLCYHRMHPSLQPMIPFLMHPYLRFTTRPSWRYFSIPLQQPSSFLILFFLLFPPSFILDIFDPLRKVICLNLRKSLPLTRRKSSAERDYTVKYYLHRKAQSYYPTKVTSPEHRHILFALAYNVKSSRRRQQDTSRCCDKTPDFIWYFFLFHTLHQGAQKCSFHGSHFCELSCGS